MNPIHTLAESSAYIVRVYQHRPIIRSSGNIRGSALLLDPWEYSRISPANNTFITKFSATPRIPLSARKTSPSAYKRKAPPSFLKYPIFLSIHYLSKLFNLFGVYITDLGIGTNLAGTPPTTFILFLSFAAKLIYTPNI
jgi:hypothetical protein